MGKFKSRFNSSEEKISVLENTYEDSVQNVEQTEKERGSEVRGPWGQAGKMEHTCSRPVGIPREDRQKWGSQ